MASDEALELLEEQCGTHRQNAQRCIRSEPRQAVYHFSRAADIHERLAAELDSDHVALAHRSRAESMRSNAHRVVQRLDLVPESGGSEQSEPGEDVELGESSGSEHFSAPADMDLSDVGGMDELKRRLQQDVQKPLEHPEYYERQGVGIENGILLYGPPGVGKSHLAKCFAGELGYNYAEIHASDVASKWVGEAPKNLKRLFDEARNNQPCVIFLDEIDALATGRDSGPQKTNTERQIVTELLQQMQSVQGSDILVIGGTNKPEELDGALLRSGRFNEKFRIPPPDSNARKEILRVQLDDESRSVDWDSIDWSKLVDWSQGFSAADLEHVVRKAARMSADESTDCGELVPVRYRHLLEAITRTEASLKYWNGGSNNSGND
jgi:transitional endoplasmic reticulum ATPase